MSARTVHPFPARMAPELALDHLEHCSTADVILDPMCGSGSVLVHAQSLGHRTIGYDVDPLAVLMSNVATAPLDVNDLISTAHDLAYEIERGNYDSTPRWHDGETQDFAEFWFGQPQRRQLTHLANAIDRIEDNKLRSALFVAMSRIIVTKAPRASLAADTSHSRPHKVIEASDYCVLAGFRKSSTDLAKLLDRRRIVGHASAHLGDARALPLESKSIDTIITSPPYLNAIDYLRGHKFSLIWMGWSIPKIREIRGGSIGSTRSSIEVEDTLISDIIEQLVTSAKDPALLPLGMIRRYATDLRDFASEAERVLKLNGSLIAVVGNSTLKGNYIRNDRITERALNHFGLSTLSLREREIPESSRYLPIRKTQNSTALTQRMRTETVLAMEKRP